MIGQQHNSLSSPSFDFFIGVSRTLSPTLTSTGKFSIAHMYFSCRKIISGERFFRNTKTVIVREGRYWKRGFRKVGASSGCIVIVEEGGGVV